MTDELDRQTGETTALPKDPVPAMAYVPYQQWSPHTLSAERALDAGTRVAAEEDPGSDMHDLLDDGTDKQALPAELRAYHERYLQAQAYETARPQHDGMMDTLEDIDMTPSAETPQVQPAKPEQSDGSFTDLFTPM